jgi:hypothetical protein
MDRRDINELIEDALLFYNDEEENSLQGEIEKIKTFSKAGLLTTDNGLVIKMKNGAEFQITIVQSK